MFVEREKLKMKNHKEENSMEITELIALEHKKQNLSIDYGYADENCLELNPDTNCGFWIFNGPWWQFLASKKTFVLLYGISTCLYTATYSYFVSTLTTMEKQYKISSKSSGLILSAHDIAQIFSSIFLTYYASRGHFPRWISVSIITVILSFLLTAAPYLIYGAGHDALSYTLEYGNGLDMNSTQEVLHQHKMKDLCYENKTSNDCSNDDDDHFTAALIFLWCSSFMTGLGGPLLSTLGTTYLDNNVKKSKAPFLLALSSFIRLLAPTIGYSLGAYCLRIYVAPGLHPTIDNTDPRWIGGWWIGWLLFAAIFSVLVPLFACFPRILPRAASRKKELMAKLITQGKFDHEMFQEPTKPSISDLMITFKRLLKNKVLVFNNLAAIFYIFGYLPFFTYQAKYIEVQYLFTAAQANMVTGTISLVFSAIGTLAAGIVITKFKPRARYLAGYNIMASFLSVLGVVAYSFFGCAANDNSFIVKNSNDISTCNVNCNCDYVKYSPVCGENNITYISACHAGCKNEFDSGNLTKVYEECSCIDKDPMLDFDWMDNKTYSIPLAGGRAKTGPCPVNCMREFYFFLIIMCFNKFLGGTEGGANFLLSLRCIDEKDKNISIGLTISVISLFALVPSPLIFGAIIDKTCVLWGKVCSGNGNCWLYDTEAMRYNLNLTAACFVVIGTLCDFGTFYYSKNVQIFDEEPIEKDEKELEILNGKENSSLNEVKALEVAN